ncbi:MAG: phasin family protein, partial [Rhodospirillales bacterium]
TDPFAPVRETILEAVNTAKAQQEKIASAAQAESDKARAAATEGFEQAITAYRENFETAVAATKAAAGNLSKIEELTRTQATELAEDRVAVIFKAMSITDPSELMKLQAELIAAEQKKAQAMAKDAVALYQGVAKDLFAPIQAQMTKAFEAASKFKPV